MRNARVRQVFCFWGFGFSSLSFRLVTAAPVGHDDVPGHVPLDSHTSEVKVAITVFLDESSRHSIAMPKAQMILCDGGALAHGSCGFTECGSFTWAVVRGGADGGSLADGSFVKLWLHQMIEMVCEKWTRVMNKFRPGVVF